MKRYLSLPIRFLALAMVIALLLTLSAVTIAGATSRAVPRHSVTTQAAAGHHVLSTCTVSASPTSQTVGVNQTARVTVDEHCPAGYTSTQITWGDGVVSRYPGGCLTPCTLFAAHSYAVPGDYHPKICLEPVNVCTTVEIRVV